MTLVARFASTIAQFRLQPGRAIVAVSGGVDSVVLLDLLNRTREHHGLELVLGHIDHGIQPGEIPRRIVEAAAARYGLPLQWRLLELGPGTTETAARVARLAALSSIAEAEAANYIILAHHANDQAETVLMRLLRGSGPAGLAGMAPRRGRYLRPLLGITRQELTDYADSARLEYWKDPANQDPIHLRSWLRTAIMPHLEERLPDVTDRLLRAAAHARDDRDAWSELLRSWPGLEWKREGRASSLHLPVLTAMPPALRQAVLGALCRDARCHAGPARIASAWNQVAARASGTTADLSNGWKFEVAFDRLRLLAPVDAAAAAQVQLTGSRGQAEWGAWDIAWRTEPAPQMQERTARVAWFVPAPLVVRGPRPGDRVDPIGGIGHRPIVRCLQEARVPSSARGGWPVIESEAEIVWLPGVCRSSHLLPAGGTPSLRLEVSPRV